MYLTAAMQHWEAEVALFEEGTFVPNPGIAVYERLLRVPERFKVQRYPLSTGRERLLTGYARLFDRDVAPEQVSLVHDVRLLMGFAARLPRYSQNTQRISAGARGLRGALFSAREPHTLLFRQLPEALGYDDLPDRVIDEYLERVRTALLELAQAYDRLLGEVQCALLAGLRLPADIRAARSEVRARAGLLQEVVAEQRLAALVTRLRDDRLADREWVESVAAVVTNKPVRSWSDAEAVGFPVAIAELGARLRRIEDVAVARVHMPSGERVVRLGVTDDRGVERRDLVRVRRAQEATVERAVRRLEEALQGLRMEPEAELAAVALLARKMLERQPEGEGEDHG